MSGSARGGGFRLREPVNSLTHFVGAVLSSVGTVVLIVLSAGDPWKTAAFLVYGISLVLLYTASTLLHALMVSEHVQRRLRVFDHAAIFLLIAGSYTPVTLVTLRFEHPGWAWALFGIAWFLALLGVLFKLLWIAAPRWLSTGLYLAMGWLALIGIVPLIRSLPPWGLFWLVMGGALYSLGAVIYGLKRPDPIPGVFGYHEIWHLLVLGGSASHYLMMLRYVLPA
jgi:hemolysin III